MYKVRQTHRRTFVYVRSRPNKKYIFDKRRPIQFQFIMSYSYNNNKKIERNRNWKWNWFRLPAHHWAWCDSNLIRFEQYGCMLDLIRLKKGRWLVYAKLTFKKSSKFWTKDGNMKVREKLIKSRFNLEVLMNMFSIKPYDSKIKCVPISLSNKAQSALKSYATLNYTLNSTYLNFLLFQMKSTIKRLHI